MLRKGLFENNGRTKADATVRQRTVNTWQNIVSLFSLKKYPEGKALLQPLKPHYWREKVRNSFFCSKIGMEFDLTEVNNSGNHERKAPRIPFDSG